MPREGLCITELFSPLARRTPERREELAGAGDARFRQMISVDDRFFFHQKMWRLFQTSTRLMARIKPSVRLAVEVLLLFVTVAHLMTLVVLHSWLVPSPSPHTAGVLAQHLVAAFRAEKAIELLRINIALPVPEMCSASRWCAEGERWTDCMWSDICQHGFVESVSCEFASELSMLQLPAFARERVYQSNLSVGLSVSLASSQETFGPLLAIPWLASVISEQRILAAFTWGPLHAEVLAREAALIAAAAAASGRRSAPVMAESDRLAAAAKNETHLPRNETPSETQSRAELLESQTVEALSLMYVSCQGRPPTSLQPLRRTSELVHQPTEWWLFKSVWLLSMSMMGLVFGMVMSFAMRSAELACFCACRILSDGSCWSSDSERSVCLEALVLVASPFAVASVLCTVAGDLSGDVTMLLLCQAVGELAARFLLRSEESRYIFPRAVLPVYAADIYYCFFHPFGFKGLMHGLLWSFQAFSIFTLFSHFEALMDLPVACPEQVTVEVRLRPRTTPSSEAPDNAISASTRQLLLEQGLLLLGDDKSYESAVVMSAVVMRALQASDAPSLQTPPPPPPEVPTGAEFLAEIDVELLGGGHPSQMLISSARSGDARCLGLAGHLLQRLLVASKTRVRQTSPLSARLRDILLSSLKLRMQYPTLTPESIFLQHSGLPRIDLQDSWRQS